MSLVVGTTTASYGVAAIDEGGLNTMASECSFAFRFKTPSTITVSGDGWVFGVATASGNFEGLGVRVNSEMQLCGVVRAGAMWDLPLTTVLEPNKIYTLVCRREIGDTGNIQFYCDSIDNVAENTYTAPNPTNPLLTDIMVGNNFWGGYANGIGFKFINVAFWRSRISDEDVLVCLNPLDAPISCSVTPDQYWILATDGIATTGSTNMEISGSIFDSDPLLPTGLVSLSNPVVPGSTFTGAILGYPEGTEVVINAAGKAITTTLESGGAFEAIFPMPVSGNSYPVLPLVNTVFSVTLSGETTSRISSISLPTDWDVLRNASSVPSNFSMLSTADRYLAKPFIDAGNPLTSLDRVMWDASVDDDFKILRNGAIEIRASTLPKSKGIWISRGDNGNIYYHTLILSEERTTLDGLFFESVDWALTGTYIESVELTIGGVETLPVSIVNGEYAIDSGLGYADWTSDIGTINSGDKIKVRILSSTIPGERSYCVLTVGDKEGYFTVTTSANPPTDGSVISVNNNDPISAGVSFPVVFDSINAEDVQLITFELGEDIFYANIQSVDSDSQITVVVPQDLPATAWLTIRVYESRILRTIRNM